MEDFTTAQIVIGGLLLFAQLLAGIVELATVGTIRPPEDKTFTYIRLAANQYQTVALPALGALISGSLVSISASVFYEVLSGATLFRHLVAGIAAFLAAEAALVVILRLVMNRVGDPSELVDNPFAIRAAAKEYSDDPRQGCLNPDFLTERLDEWESSMPRHSLNIAKEVDASRVTKSLDTAADVNGMWRWIGTSLAVYKSALIKFPMRFGWPLLGAFFFLTGSSWYGLVYANVEIKHWWYLIIVMVIDLAIAVMPTLIYCVARGNRARLWHRINRKAVKDARTALACAQNSKASIEEEDAVLRRVLERSDTFLAHHQYASKTSGSIILQLGRLQITINPK
ncbi:hypothetical protein HMPREF0183_0901 [Brevibacterium mcbrellneri ATCC 49030]|uniref:Uncharacterized protein n=1 Tax=Brevibacterium mcbrellneri ATCC 49030 TaxID=585530 RepID=D4YLU1_9MICO|nr:hypothetical protein [Brevibacterium mcbrellneri]EFG47824.1 hypothetical protein HMPREF0183_0901 [Brevibacterium mcbrellneri ATCC 49030]